MCQSGFVFGPCPMSEVLAYVQRLERIYGNITIQELVDHFATVQQAKREGTLLDADPIQ